MIAALLAGALVIPLGLDLYMPVPDGNPLTAARIEQGRRLFRDRRLSRDGTIACSTCHEPARAFSQPRALPVGIAGRQGRRNAPALLNRAWGRSFFWDGRANSLEDQVLQPISDPTEMDLSPAEAGRRVGLSAGDLARALASYVRSILSGDSPYDRFVSGDRAALSPEEQAGLRLFRGTAGCSACHIGPTLSDERLHNTGVAWRGGAFADEGGGDGRFKTPTLREVARTAPYMHDGSVATLDEVVDYYDRGGNANGNLDADIRPLRLSERDKRALVAFLQSLSGRITDGS